MKILGIESSCDETAAAVVEDGKAVRSSALATSQKLHIKTGGIVPEIAARKQIESIIPVISEALSSTDEKDIDAIAVTAGPGLIGSLLVGVETAKTLSFLWNKPIIPINHLVAHIYANWIDQTPEFPAIALVVSGGHTDFVYMKKHGEIKWIGGTRDDAAGEAFDKTARLLGLPYPGGPAISEKAEEFRKTHKSYSYNLFPRPMQSEDTIDVSFSGLKTSVKNYLLKNPNTDVALMSAEIEEAVVDTLIAKAQKAIAKYSPKSFLLAGGVSANKRLREEALEKLKDKVKVFIPEPTLSTDNAVMIATAAFYNQKLRPWQEIASNPSLSIEDKF